MLDGQVVFHNIIAISQQKKTCLISTQVSGMFWLLHEFILSYILIMNLHFYFIFHIIQSTCVPIAELVFD